MFRAAKLTYVFNFTSYINHSVSLPQAVSDLTGTDRRHNLGLSSSWKSIHLSVNDGNNPFSHESLCKGIFSHMRLSP